LVALKGRGAAATAETGDQRTTMKDSASSTTSRNQPDANVAVVKSGRPNCGLCGGSGRIGPNTDCSRCEGSGQERPKPGPPSEAMQLWKDYRAALLDGESVREAGGAEVTEAILALEAENASLRDSASEEDRLLHANAALEARVKEYDRDYGKLVTLHNEWKARAERAEVALRHIISLEGQSEIPGLAPEFYGHARTIAENALGEKLDLSVPPPHIRRAAPEKS